MTNHTDSEDILIDQQKNEKVTDFKYLGQTTPLKDTTEEETCQNQSSVELFWKTKKGSTPG